MTSVEFGLVRADALTALERGARTRSYQWRPCVWQLYRPAVHVGPYCNALSHLQALDELLANSSWCDHLELRPELDESEEAEALFRFVGLVLLAWEQVEADLRLIHGAASPGRGNSRDIPETVPLRGFLNHVIKHRGTPHGDGAAFHRQHHHGPYLFEDAPQYRRALPSDGAYTALGHRTPATATMGLPLVVPSVVDAMQVLSRALRRTSSLLRDPSARRRVVEKFGVHVFPDAE